LHALLTELDLLLAVDGYPSIADLRAAGAQRMSAIDAVDGSSIHGSAMHVGAVKGPYDSEEQNIQAVTNLALVSNSDNAKALFQFQ
jgi:hypothetical protein